MNLLISCIGRRGYLAELFRHELMPGDRVLGTSNSPWTPGFRHCDRTFLMPGIHEDRYVESVLSLCQENEVGMIISCFDPDIERLSEHVGELRQIGVVPFLVSREVSNICFDKFKTIEFLQRHGFQTPNTFERLSDAKKALDRGEIEFPVYVKSRCGYGSKNLLVARNNQELETFYDYAPPMIVQEKLAGDELSFDILNDLQGNVISAIVKRKIAMRSGETDQAITIHDPQLLEFACQLGAALGHVGPLDVDLFMKGGLPCVLELNPRFGGGYPVSHFAGADFPRLMIEMAKGGTVMPKIGEYRADRCMMKEIQAFYCNDVLERCRDLRENSRDVSQT